MAMAPEEIRLGADKRTLTVAWADGTRAELPAEYLRVESPSAEVKGHGPDSARLVSGKRDVTVKGLEPVGNYAVKVVFSDGHATGIFTWEYLRELGAQREARWARYVRDLQAAGLNRETAGPMVLRRDLV